MYRFHLYIGFISIMSGMVKQMLENSVLEEENFTLRASNAYLKAENAALKAELAALKEAEITRPSSNAILSLNAPRPDAKLVNKVAISPDEQQSGVNEPMQPTASGQMKETHQIGITKRGIRLVLQLLMDAFEAGRFPGVTNVHDLALQDVVDLFVKVETAKTKCRLAECGLIPSEDIREPSYFISHAWKGSTVFLLQTVLNFLRNASETETAVWIDFIAVRHC